MHFDLQHKHSKTLILWEWQRWIAHLHKVKVEWKEYVDYVVVPLDKEYAGPGIEYIEAIRFNRWNGGEYTKGLASYIKEYWNAVYRLNTNFNAAHTRALVYETYGFRQGTNGRKDEEFSDYWTEYFPSYTVKGFHNNGQQCIVESPYEDELCNIQGFNFELAPDKRGKTCIKISHKY